MAQKEISLKKFKLAYNEKTLTCESVTKLVNDITLQIVGRLKHQ